MSRRAALVLAVGLLLMGVSNRAEAIYSRSSVPFAWKYSPNLESTTSSQDDGLSAFINLPFSFPFQDDVFTQIRISSNGFVTLSNASSLPCGGCYAPQNFAPAGARWRRTTPLPPGGPTGTPPRRETSTTARRRRVRGGVVVRGPYGARRDRIMRSPCSCLDGRFRCLDMTVNGGSLRWLRKHGCVGYPGRSSAAFGDSTLFTAGSGGTLLQQPRLRVRRASDNLNTASSTWTAPFRTSWSAGHP